MQYFSNSPTLLEPYYFQKKNCFFFSFFFLEEYSCEFGSAKYYAYCAFGGLLSCGLTHTAVVPLDLVKCRIQVSKLWVCCFVEPI